MLPQIQDISTSVPLDTKALSEIELNEMIERKILLQFEKLKLSTDIKDTVLNFDNLVYKLRRERFGLVLESKAGDIHLMNMFRELELLQLFEETDKNLKGRLDDHVQEKIKVSKNKVSYLDYVF